MSEALEARAAACPARRRARQDRSVRQNRRTTVHPNPSEAIAQGGCSAAQRWQRLPSHTPRRRLAPFAPTRFRSSPTFALLFWRLQVHVIFEEEKNVFCEKAPKLEHDISRKMAGASERQLKWRFSPLITQV